MNENYILATNKSWALSAFYEYRDQLPGDWTVVTTPSDLVNLVPFYNPKMIFFPHWSAKVPEDLVTKFECVCFHMTDLPKGRGGSPLQNLILGGHDATQISALRMDKEYDSGPIYFKKKLSLAGSAHEIFIRSSAIIMEMMIEMIVKKIEPTQQVGTATYFKRRTPKQSEMNFDLDLDKLHDFIRMLDAPGYPRAFIKLGSHKVMFHGAKMQGELLNGKFTIVKDE